MFKKSMVIILVATLLPQVSLANDRINASKAALSCYSDKWTEQALLNLAKKNFDIEHDAERNALAQQLIYCLAVPNADIRDGVAYTGLSSWLRGNKLPADVVLSIFKRLIDSFAMATDDEKGVYQPFVALVLSELARADRKTPYLSAEQRELLVVKSTNYMASIKDYRGFEAVVGWRHNVAHTADIFLQLALNPAVNKSQLTRMLNAIGQQILAKNKHFYTYGEPERLTRALLYIMLQNQHNAQDWQNWLLDYITTAPLTDWKNAYSSQQGLAQLHNARAFLNAVFVTVADSNNEQLKMLKPALVETLNNLP